MDCLGQVLNIVPCLWECSTKHATYYIGGLEDNLASLRSENFKLKTLSEDVKSRVREAEEQHKKPKNQVHAWLESVGDVENQVEEILQKGTEELERRCIKSCCQKNCKSSYKVGRKVTKMIPQVTRLIEEGKFDDVADRLPLALVDELPMENAVVGFESKFEEVWQSVQRNDAAIIGLVGMGGVGKTTLLKQLNNEFSKTSHEYDLVVWIMVSKPANLVKIQDSFQSKLNIPDHLWAGKSECERAVVIFNKLKDKKFMVLLDDIWERLDLSVVGIPQPSKDSMSKIVFTTRSQDVCQSMEALILIKVSCLLPDQAYDLFCSKVGEDVLKCDQEIKGLMKDVVQECQGLPLALITISRSMRGKTDAQQWKDAKWKLENYPSTFPGIEGGVFSKLLFSYDSLPTTTLQKCFEYCSLYPEDHNINKDDLIKAWIGERLIDEYDNWFDAFLQGRQIMESLMQAGLLEVGQWAGYVKMHDVIRDMSLWLACEGGEKKNKFWVQVVAFPDDISTTPKVMANWGANVEKVSLWGRGITMESLARLSSYSNLLTLIIRDTELEEMDGGIFQSMKVLKVLDLHSNNGLKRLPREIAGLTNLEYLNIMWTRVMKLPREVEQLKKLRFLTVPEGTIIPRGVISSLRMLQMFEQYSTRKSYEYEEERKTMEREMLEELEGLEDIMYLHLTLVSAIGIQKLLDSPKLQNCIGTLVLNTKDSLPVELDLGTRALTKHLEKLDVLYCAMSVIKLGRSSFCSNIRKVWFCNCDKIRNVNSLVYVPNLCFLEVKECDSLEELIGEDTNVGLSTLFLRLEHLYLDYLPKLRSICPQSALPFPSLKYMMVRRCEDLKKLPLDSNSAHFGIEGEIEWWDALEWDSQATKNAFFPDFIEEIY